MYIRFAIKSALTLCAIISATLATRAQSANFSLPAVQKTSFKKDSFNIRNYGAIADGLTLNTVAINKAITTCNQKGGGVVVVPAGFWLTGPVELKSNVNLYLASNSTLQFTTDKSQYPIVAGNWEGIPQMRNQSPIFSTNQTNIAITGKGIIDGGGEVWRQVKKDKLTETQWTKLLASGGVTSSDKKSWYPSEVFMKASAMKNPGAIQASKTAADYEAIKDFLRPNLLVLTKCKRILLEGVTFQNSPAWCLHPLMSEDIIIRNVYAKNPWYAQNGDGLDLESCKNVLVEGSTFDVGDDGICIKSGRDEEGRKRGMPTENVLVKNCVVYHAHGGFVIGSEMSGGAKKIKVEDCTFIGTDIGLRFKTTRGRGGVVEDIYMNNIAMKEIPGEAILFDMYYAAQDPVPLAGEKRAPPKVEQLPVDETTPQFQRFTIRNVVCNGASKAIFVRGLPEMNVKQMLLENITIQSKAGLDMTEASGFDFRNVKLVTTDPATVLNIHNSNKVSFEKLDYPGTAETVLNVTGEKSKSITVPASIRDKVKLAFGAEQNAVIIK
jgi:polygalacturonase